jgi:hypothetical protein
VSIRARFVFSVICAAALLVGGVFLERLGPRSVSAGAPASPVSGLWSCPHGGGEGWRVWVTVANPGPEAVEVRMTTSAGGAARPPAVSVVEPATFQYFEVPAPLEGSATAVEYLGGTVAAGSVVIPPEGGLAAEPCAGSPGSFWYVPEASTLRGQTAELVVHNPFAAQAVVDVILWAGGRQIRPGRLQGVVLGSLDARAFELNHYALGEEALAAQVLVPQGRVAASSIVASDGAVRSSLAVAAPSTRWVLPGLGGEAEVIVQALSEQDAPVGAELQGDKGGVPAIDLEAVSAGTAEVFRVAQADGGLVVQSDGPRAMVAGRRMLLEAAQPAPAPEKGSSPSRRRKGGGKDAGKGGGKKKGGGQKEEEEPSPPPTADPAATVGTPSDADRWLVPPATPPEGGSSVVLLQNTGDAEVTATVTLIGTDGPVGEPAAVTVPPRSTVRYPVPGGTPAAALVEGSGLVAAQAALSPGAFAVILGLPI